MVRSDDPTARAARTHRVALPVLEGTVGETVAAIAGAVLSVALGVALAFFVGTRLGSRTVWIGLAPIALFITWLRRRHDTRVFAAGELRTIEASERRVRIGGREHRVSSASYGAGALRLRVAGGLAVVSVLATITEARAITDALGVKEEGLRTVRVWGPLAARPVVGITALTASPLLAVFALLVLANASQLSSIAYVVFGGIAAVSTVGTVLAAAPRTLRVEDDRVDLHWLGRTHSHPLVAITSIAIERDAIVLAVRGERAQRLPLIPRSTATAQTLAASREEAVRRAEGPVALASSRRIADVFE
jgi:hypothetical protein